MSLHNWFLTFWDDDVISSASVFMDINSWRWEQYINLKYQESIIQWHRNTLCNRKYLKCSHTRPKQLGLMKTLHLSNWWAHKPWQFAPVIHNMFNSSKEQISCPFHFFFSEPQRWKSLEGRSGVNDEQDTLISMWWNSLKHYTEYMEAWHEDWWASMCIHIQYYI